MTRARPIRALASALSLTLVLCALGAEAASAAGAPVFERALDERVPHRGTAGSTFHSLTSRPFRVDGSPYRWVIEATQSRSDPGLPPSDPNLRIIASRAASGGPAEQVHTWSFDLAANSFSFDGRLRHVSLDTGLIPAYGAIFLDLEDLGPTTTAKSRCPKSGQVLSSRASRGGILRGSVTFLPGFSDPDVPDQVSISHVRATIARTKYTGRECTYPRTCDPGKTLSSLQFLPDGGYQLAAGEMPSSTGLVFVEMETAGAADLTHLVFAFDHVDVVQTTATTVTLLSDVGRPFIRPGDTMAWTKGAKDTQATAKCRRVTWTLEMPTGSFRFKLDSGPQTLAAPATAEFEVVTRR